MIPTLLIVGLVLGRWWRVVIPAATIAWPSVPARDIGRRLVARRLRGRGGVVRVRERLRGRSSVSRRALPRSSSPLTCITGLRGTFANARTRQDDVVLSSRRRANAARRL